MVHWDKPPEDLTGILVQIPLDKESSNSIKDPNANITMIIWYILRCIRVLAEEIHYMKRGH